MADTNISEAVVYPQDAGTGVSEAEADYNSAGYQGVLSQGNGEEFKVGMSLTVDAAAENVDVSAGHAYIKGSGNSVQSSGQTAHDTTLPAGSDMMYVVVFPTAVADLALGADTDNDVYLAIDESSNDSIYVRHGSAVSAPTDPHIKLGTANTSTGVAVDENAGPRYRATDVSHVDGGSIQASFDGLVACLGAGLGPEDAIDPDETTTPVQDAIDVVAAAGGGIVHLPAGTIEETATIKMREKVSLLGYGINTSTISFPSTDTDGIHFDSVYNGGDPVSKVKMDGFCMMGARVNGPGDTTGSAIRHVSGMTHDITIGDIMFTYWTDAVYRVDRNTAPFQISWNHMLIYETDAGNATNPNGGHFGNVGGLIVWDDYIGPGNTFNQITAYPTSFETGVRSNLLYAKGGDFTINHINLGRHIGSVVIGCDDLHLNIRAVNWEPSASPPPFSDELFKFAGSRHPKTVWNVQIATDTVDDLMLIDPDWWAGSLGGNVYLGRITEVNGTHTGDAITIVNDDIAAPVFYQGTASKVNNVWGNTLSHPVVCLVEGSWKTSAGTGLSTGVDRYVPVM